MNDHIGLPKVRRHPPIQVLGYASVDAQEGAHSGVQLKRQGDVIASECDRRNLSLLSLVREHEPQHGSAFRRPGVDNALRRIATGEASGLVVAELSRLAPSVPELGRVLEWFVRTDARLVVAATGLDTEEEAGRIAVRTIVDVSARERARLSKRTRNGIQAARLKGLRGVADFPEVRERIARMRADGVTLQAIADQLNAENVPTIRGGAYWRPSSVQTAAGYRRPPLAKAPDGI